MKIPGVPHIAAGAERMAVWQRLPLAVRVVYQHAVTLRPRVLCDLVPRTCIPCAKRHEPCPHRVFVAGEIPADLAVELQLARFERYWRRDELERWRWQS